MRFEGWNIAGLFCYNCVIKLLSLSHGKSKYPANTAIVFKNNFNYSHRVIYGRSAICNCGFKYIPE